MEIYDESILKEAKAQLLSLKEDRKSFIQNDKEHDDIFLQDINAINIILQALEDKEKIINEMAEYLAIVRDCPNEDKGANLDCENRCSNDDNIYAECWKLYFENKIKEE